MEFWHFYVHNDIPALKAATIILNANHLIWVKSRKLCRCETTCMSEKPLIDLAREKILSLVEETKFAANGIVSRTLLRTANSRTVLFGFAAGQELTEHTSTQYAVIQVLSGKCEFSLDGKPHSLKAGDFLYMPPNLPHAVQATTQFSMLLTLAKPVETEKFDPLLAKTKIQTLK
jgi:quercetin dioxygenase-like cupin family protein